MPKLKTRKSFVKRFKVSKGDRPKILKKAPNQAKFRSVKSGRDRQEARKMVSIPKEHYKKVLSEL